VNQPPEQHYVVNLGDAFRQRRRRRMRAFLWRRVDAKPNTRGMGGEARLAGGQGGIASRSATTVAQSVRTGARLIPSVGKAGMVGSRHAALAFDRLRSPP
jgi:hypothetical protein